MVHPPIPRWGRRMLSFMASLPRMNKQELQSLTGGALVVRYLEAVRRYDRMPDAQWLRQRLDDTAMEMQTRMELGTLSDALCGLLRHVHDGSRDIHQRSCADS
jgi:hypothetical protein